MAWRNPLQDYINQHLGGVVRQPQPVQGGLPLSALTLASRGPSAMTPREQLALQQQVEKREAARQAGILPDAPPTSAQRAAAVIATARQQHQQRLADQAAARQIPRTATPTPADVAQLAAIQAARNGVPNPVTSGVIPRTVTNPNQVDWDILAAMRNRQPQPTPSVNDPVVIDPNQAVAEMVESGALTPQQGEIDPNWVYDPGAARGGGVRLSNLVTDYVEGLGEAGGQFIDDPSVASALGVVGAVANVPGSQIPYEWNIGVLGDLTYDRARGVPDQWRDWRQYNPFFYADDQFNDWSSADANKPTIINTHQNGIDIDGDGVIDLKGGEAVYAEFLRSLPQDDGLWFGDNSLITQLVRAAALDPLVYAAMVAGGSGGLVRALDQKVANGGTLSTMEKALYYGAKGAEGVARVPNVVADAPFTVIGGVGRGIGRGAQRMGVPNIGNPFAPSSATRRADDLAGVAEARSAQVAAQQAAINAMPSAPADEARVIQQGAQLPAARQAQPVPSTAPIVEPTTGQTASAIPTRPATDVVSVGRFDGDTAITDQPTPGQTQPAVSKGSGQWERVIIDRTKGREKFGMLNPDGELVDIVDAPRDGKSQGVWSIQERDRLNAELSASQAAGIDVPSTERDPNAPATKTVGTGKYERIQVPGGTKTNPRYTIFDPEGKPIETVEGNYSGATAWKRVRDLNTDLESGLKPVPGRRGTPDPTFWDTPSTFLPDDVRAVEPSKQALFEQAYASDPRTPIFTDKMRAFDQSPEKTDLINAGLSGKALDSTDQALEVIRHSVEEQRPIYRQVVGEEPKPHQFTYSKSIDEAVPTIERGGSRKGSRATGRGNEPAIIERAVFGTDAEATRAREWLHIQIGRKDLPEAVRTRYQTLLDETSRLRQLDRQAIGGQQALPVSATPPVQAVADEAVELTPEQQREAALAAGQQDMFGAPAKIETLEPSPAPVTRHIAEAPPRLPNQKIEAADLVPSVRAAKGVVSVDPRQLQIDPQNFQPRSARYNRSGLTEESVNDIVTNFDPNRMDPIVVWRRPEDGALVVLSGHHRREAALRLGLQGIDARIVEGDLATAKRVARQSNSITTLKPTEYGRAIREEMEIEGKSWKGAVATHKLKSGDAKRYVSTTYLPENLAELVDNGQFPVNQAAVVGDAVRDGTITPADAQVFYEQQILQRGLSASAIEDVMNGLRYAGSGPSAATDMFSGMALGQPTASNLFTRFEMLGQKLRDANRLRSALKTLGKSSMADPADTVRLLRVEAEIDDLSRELGRRPPKGANPGQGPNLAGLIFDAIDTLPGPRARVADEVAAVDSLTEVDQLFNEGGLTAEQREILSRPLVIGGEPMSLAELADRNAILYGEKDGLTKTLEIYRAITYGNARPAGWKGKALRALQAYDTASAMTREAIQFNLVTGARGSLGDAIGDGYTLIVTGHPGAALRQLNPRGVRRTLAAVRAIDPAMLSEVPEFAAIHEAGLVIPQEFVPRDSGRSSVGSGLDYETPVSRMQDQTTVHRVLTGGHGNKATGAIMGVFANKTFRDFRTAMDLHRRMVTYADQFRKELPEALGAFSQRLNVQATERGVSAAELKASIADAAQRRAAEEGRRWRGGFAPGDVLAGTGDAGLARTWRVELQKVDKASRNEVNRVLFSYKRSNADEVASRIAFFHYWQSRSLILHGRTATKNPVLMANYYRTWEALKEKTEREGYPPSVRGFIRCMGDSAGGWSSLLDPVGILVPFRVFAEAGGDEDRPFWEKIGVFLNPWVEGAAAAFGLTDAVPDVSGSYSVRNMVRATLDWGNAHGMDFLPGGDSPSGDFVRRIEQKVYETANAVLRTFKIPAKEFTPYDPRTSQIVQLRDRVEQIATDEWGPRSGWTDDQRNEVADAKKRVEVGANGNWLSEQAWDDYTDAQMGTRAAGFVVPGVRTVNQDLTKRRQGNDRAHDAWSSGGTPAPEDEAAADAMSETNAGSPEVITLAGEQDAYNAIGTERQQNLAKGWSNIARAETLPAGGYEIGGQWYQTSAIVRMPKEQREILANQWVRDHDGTAELREYRDQRDAFVASHPEYQGFDTYKDAVYQHDGGARGFRNRAEKDHPEFADELEQKRQSLKAEGKTGAVLENELDQWAASAQGYNAFRGVRQSIYDDEPKNAYDPSKDAFGGSWGAAAGTSSGSSSSGGSGGKVQSLKKKLAVYQAKMQMAEDLIGMDPTRLSPAMRRVYEVQGILPEASTDLLLYLEWGASQPPGSDNTIDAYVAYLDELEDAEAVAAD